MELAMACHGVGTTGRPKKVPRGRTAVTENLRFLSFRLNEYARERDLISSIIAEREGQQQDPIQDKRILFRTSFQCQIVSSSPSSSSSESSMTTDTHVWHPPPLKSKDAARCLICLEGYSPRQLICISKKRKCNHIFHRDCMEGWMLTNPCCPLCRVDLMTTHHGKQPGKITLTPP